jgi:hypothetical protein
MPTNTNVSEDQQYPDESSARKSFEESKRLFLDLANWPALSGAGNAGFVAVSPDGHVRTGVPVQPGDFIRIDLWGPSGYDWVRIEEISAGADKAQIVVRPSYDPTASPITTEITSHFFTREATNTLTLERRGDSLMFLVNGRNEVPNVLQPEAGGDWKAKMNAVKWGLGSLGLQAHQWRTMGKNVLHPTSPGKPPLRLAPEPPERWSSVSHWSGTFSISCKLKTSTGQDSFKLSGNAVGIARPDGTADVLATLEAERVDPSPMGTFTTRFHGQERKASKWSVNADPDRGTYSVSFGTYFSVACKVEQTFDGKPTALDGRTGWAQGVNGPPGPFTGPLPKNGLVISGSTDGAVSGGHASASWSFTGHPGPVG